MDGWIDGWASESIPLGILEMDGREEGLAFVNLTFD
jgi:hypothetical protein